MEYFDHNVNAADDDAIMALRLEHGGAAIDCYWAVIEKMYRDERPVPVDENHKETKALTHRLAIGFQELKNYVETMISLGLLEYVENSDNMVTSERVERTIERVRKRHEIAVESGKKGGRPKGSKTKGKANANQKLSKSQAIKIKEDRSKSYTAFTSYNVADGADAGKTAPPAPKCPLCGLDLESTGIDGEEWWCNNCKDGFTAEKVVV